MKLALAAALLCLALSTLSATDPEAPAGFDNKSNGMVDDATHQADQAKFDEIEGIADGLGPIYNAQSCRECHQNPTSGGTSQVTELRVGRKDDKGIFHNPDVPINNGKETISGRTLINDRAICPSGDFPDTEVQEHVPNNANIRTTRTSLNVLGDGFVEAVADSTFEDISRKQCKSSHGRICGQVLYVPIVEAPGKTGVGRFGWKDQHASLLSFSGDAYLNEMGITTNLFPDEVTNLCNTAAEPNDKPGADGLADVDHFARFMRASKAPARDPVLAATDAAKNGEKFFGKIGCDTCHLATLTTAPAGTKINGDAFTIPDALGGKIFHPYSDFLLHNVGTGDGIVIPMIEHYGKRMAQMRFERFSAKNLQNGQFKLRTPPLWGIRFRNRLMHDGKSTTMRDAVLRHSREASGAAERFRKLPRKDQEAVIAFVNSL